MPRPGEDDLALVGQAVSALRRGLGPDLHPAASAARTDEGDVVVALALRDALCSEASAVAAVLARGRRVATLATVQHVTEDRTRVVSPCPSCRALLRRHAPAVRVVHLADGLQVSEPGRLP